MYLISIALCTDHDRLRISMEIPGEEGARVESVGTQRG